MVETRAVREDRPFYFMPNEFGIFRHKRHMKTLLFLCIIERNKHFRVVLFDKLKQNQKSDYLLTF